MVQPNKAKDAKTKAPKRSIFHITQLSSSRRIKRSPNSKLEEDDIYSPSRQRNLMLLRR